MVWILILKLLEWLISKCAIPVFLSKYRKTDESKRKVAAGTEIRAIALETAQSWPYSVLCKWEFYHWLLWKHCQASDFLTLEGNYFYFKCKNSLPPWSSSQPEAVALPALLMSLFAKRIPSPAYTHAGLPAPGCDVPSPHCSSSPRFLTSRPVPHASPGPPHHCCPPAPTLHCSRPRPPAIPTWEGPFLPPTPLSSSGLLAYLLPYIPLTYWHQNIFAFRRRVT